MQSMVEGHVPVLPTFEARIHRACPSTPRFAGGPPPRSGEDL